MEATTPTPAHTINLDGVAYDITRFSQGVQQAITIYNRFAGQLQDQRLEVMKTEAAIQLVGSQITEAIKKELAEEKPGDEAVSDAHITNGSDGEQHSAND